MAIAKILKVLSPVMPQKWSEKSAKLVDILAKKNLLPVKEVVTLGMSFGFFVNEHFVFLLSLRKKIHFVLFLFLNSKKSKDSFIFLSIKSLFLFLNVLLCFVV